MMQFSYITLTNYKWHVNILYKSVDLGFGIFQIGHINNLTKKGMGRTKQIESHLQSIFIFLTDTFAKMV